MAKGLALNRRRGLRIMLENCDALAFVRIHDESHKMALDYALERGHSAVWKRDGAVSDHEQMLQRGEAALNERFVADREVEDEPFRRTDFLYLTGKMGIRRWQIT